MVAFYAPKAGGWDRFKGEYERAARELVTKYVSEKGTHKGSSEHPMQMSYLAKIDITNMQNLELSRTYGVKSYPTFIFFDNIPGHVKIRMLEEPFLGHSY